MKKLLYIAAVFAVVLFCVSCNAFGVTLEQPPQPISDNEPDTGDPQKQPDADNTDEPQFMEPDNNPVDIDMGLRVEMADTFAQGETITYSFTNITDSKANILNIPRLYMGTENEENLLPYADGPGFCGTPDCIAAYSTSLVWTLDAKYLFGSDLPSGSYLLTFDVLDDNYEVVETLYAEFEVLSPIVFIS